VIEIPGAMATMGRWPPCLLTICSLLLAGSLALLAVGDRGGHNLLQTGKALKAPALVSLSKYKADAHGSARSAGYGPLGTQICGMYAEHFAANGSDEKSCRHVPVQDMCKHPALDPSFCEGNLNKQRCEMPQIPSGFSSKEDDDFAKWKEVEMADGINITQESIDVAHLVSHKPSQMFINRCKVCSMVWSGNACFAEGEPTADTCKNGRATGCYCLWKSGVSVTEDGYVLDGHHRWASARIMVSDETLRRDMQAVVEHYGGVPNHPKATVDRVIETAAKHPTLAKHTKCSAEA